MLGKLLLFLLLTGCSSKTVVNNMAEDIRSDLSLIAEEVYALPPECGEQTKLGQRVELVLQRIDIMEEAYQTETGDLKSKNRRLETANNFLVIVLLLALILGAKSLLKKA